MAGGSMQPAMSGLLAVGNLGLSSYALEVSLAGAGSCDRGPGR